MTRLGPGHPLDVELADLADGTLAVEQAGALDVHLDRCLLCRLKLTRLRDAPPAPEPLTFPPITAFALPRLDPAADPTPGDLWLAGSEDGDDERILVTVLRLAGDRALVAPVTLDVEAADEETVVVEADPSPLTIPLAVFPALATELPRAALVARVASGLDLTAAPATTAPPPPVSDATDPRLDVRQHLAARLAALEDIPPDPATALDAPRPGPGHLRSALLQDLRTWRGPACRADALDSWGGVTLAVRHGWTPLAVVDEIGVVLVVLDTPAGLADDAEFDAARSVLTRFNATALVVLAGAVSDVADVYDAPALNTGIDLPTGRHAPPRPLISGLSPFDAITKYLDQHTGARSMSPPTRGTIGRVDVGEVLRAEAAGAIADVARQGARFKIAPKRQGYESAAADPDAVAAALARAFDGDADDDTSVVEHLLALARREPPPSK